MEFYRGLAPALFKSLGVTATQSKLTGSATQ